MSLFDFLKKKTPTETKKVEQPVVVQEKEIQKGNVKVSNIDISLDVIESMKKRFIAIDFETTGLNSYSDRIVEIGAVIFENGIVVSQFATLVNPGVNIPECASKVNRITNDMVKSAPNEKEAINNLVEFARGAVEGNYYFCAHNASFDSGFLHWALWRNGFDGTLKFVDTLSTARRTLYDLENYKQDTVAQHFGIINNSSHRASADAEVCGKIMIQLFNLVEEKLIKQAQYKEREKELSVLTDEQKAWGAYIQKNIIQQGLDTEYLCFKGRSGNWMECNFLYDFLRIKFGKTKKYVVVKKGSIKKSDFCTEPCVASEGGEEFFRVVLNSLSDMDPLMPYVIKKYISTQKSVNENIKYGYIDSGDIKRYLEFATVFQNDDLDGIIIAEQQAMMQKQAEEESKLAAKEKAEEERRIKKEQRELEKQRKAMEPPKVKTRAIVKLDDSGVILEEFISISEAVEKTGINSKSIRDAAKGVQKHAGGFCWQYKDEELSE